jgi:hypothetical protein
MPDAQNLHNPLFVLTNFALLQEGPTGNDNLKFLEQSSGPGGGEV